MRQLLILAGSCVILATAGCDLLKRGQDKKDETSAAGSSTAGSSGGATTANTETTAANTGGSSGTPSKPASSGCTWPESADHDVTITKGCAVTAKGSLTVQEGSTFTIEEGVKISFETDTYLWVEYGKLVVKGTESAPVTFTSANKSPAAGDWIGIGFEEKTMAGTAIDHLILEYAGSSAHAGQGGIELKQMRQGGRIALCGAVSVYNATERPPGPWNLPLAIGRRLTLRGFIVTDHAERFPDFVSEVGGYLREGRLRHRETVVEGLENAPEAFIGLLRGENVGKMVVKLA